MSQELKADRLNEMFFNPRVDLAYRLYNMQPCEINKLQLPKAIVRTIKESASNEFDFTINSDNKSFVSLQKFLKNNLDNIINDLLIGGKVCYKPYVKGERAGVTLYNSKDFYPIFNSFQDLETVVFKSDIRIDRYNSYVLVEEHHLDYDTKEYRIDYQLYRGIITDEGRQAGRNVEFGARVDLHSIPDTAYLEDFYVIPDVEEHLCTILSLDNCATSNKGVCIFNSSIELITDAEKQYSNLNQELTAGSLGIIAPGEFLRVAGKGRNGQISYELPEGKDKLWRVLKGVNSKEAGITVFAPTLRDESYINGLNTILRKIELNCNLYYGSLSDVTEVQKTASEVISSHARFYTLVNNIKDKLKESIEQTVQDTVIVYNAIVPSFMNENITVDFEIGDSVEEVVGSDKTE